MVHGRARLHPCRGHATRASTALGARRAAGAGENVATLLLARAATPEQAALSGNHAGGRVLPHRHPRLDPRSTCPSAPYVSH
jgi:hypothetical protein